MSDSRPLSGKTAIVTGASSGIGRCIAESLGGAGACVYLVGRSQGPMDELAKRIEQAGDDVVAPRRLAARKHDPNNELSHDLYLAKNVLARRPSSLLLLQHCQSQEGSESRPPRGSGRLWGRFRQPVCSLVRIEKPGTRTCECHDLPTGRIHSRTVLTWEEWKQNEAAVATGLP